MAVTGANRKAVIAAVIIISVAAIALIAMNLNDDGGKDDLPKFTIDGQTDLEGNFFISFVYTKNIMMLDGKGNIVWSKHEDVPTDGTKLGYWDFKKHIIDGKVYYREIYTALMGQSGDSL